MILEIPMKFKISTYIKELFLFLLLVAATLLVLIATHKASHTRTIVINEVCSNDFSLVENSAGKYADYIELYNAGDTTISLLNWTLHTGKKDSGTYTFGDIRLLPQARVLLIHRDDAASDTDTSSITVSPKDSFSLEIPCSVAKDGDTLYLRNSSDKTTDYVTVPALTYNTVYARETDGADTWKILTGTPCTDNASASAPFWADRDDAPAEPAYPLTDLSLPAEAADAAVLSISIPEDSLYGDDGIFLSENRTLSGRTAERECQVDYFSPDRSNESSFYSGLRVSKRSNNLQCLDFNLYARNIYGSDTFSTDFFGNGIEHDRLLLLHVADKQYLLYTLLAQQNIQTVSFLPCSVFLNGTFYGNYYLAEPVDENYLKSSYGVSGKNLTILTENQLTYGSSYGLLEYRALIADATANGLTDPAAYENFCEKIDIDSLINYYVLHILLNDNDFSPYDSCLVWRSETVDPGNTFSDGKWHYEITGLSRALFTQNSNTLTNTFSHVQDTDPLFEVLLQNPDFRDRFSEYFTDLAENRLNEAAAEALLAGTTYPEEDTDNLEGEFSQFFRDRSVFILSYLEDLLTEEGLSD